VPTQGGASLATDALQQQIVRYKTGSYSEITSYGDDLINKAEALYRLAQKRKNNIWEGYYSIADFHDGIYECDYVSPYTKTAGNLNAEAFIMLQDWSSFDSLNGPICQDSIKYGHTTGKFIYSNL
jgi:hypothetical protein